MAVSQGAGATNEMVFGRDSAGTQSLLRFGVFVGPFYLAVGLIQAVVRDGFDLKRHALSHLANGPGGWVQTANFVLSGLMVIAAAVGIARVLGPKRRALSWFLGGFGASMLVAAAFPADPVDGFPVGTPVGDPTSISTTGLVHFAAGGLGFVLLALSCFTAAWVMSRRNAASLARLSLLGGLAVAVGFFGPFVGLPFGVFGIWVAVVVGWVWLVVMSLRLSRLTPAGH
jgi:hypothetical protein